MEDREKRRVALVTGGARRLGRHISLALAGEGYDVIVNYNRSGEEAQKTTRLIRDRGGAADAIAADVSRSEEVQSLVDRAAAVFGRIHLLVNNAAVIPPSSFAELDEETWDQTVDVNLKGTFLCCKAVGTRMLEWGEGQIVNVACLGAFQPWHKHIAYSVSKAGVVMLTRCLAKALAPSVRVNAVAPGTVLVNDEPSPTKLQPPPEKIPLQRYAAPGDICDAILFLTRGSNYITGQVILVDGGVSLQSIW